MKWNLVVTVVVALTIGLLIGNNTCRPKKPQYFDKPGFKPDTFIKKVYIPDTGGRKTEVIPPKIVYKYKEVPVPVIKYVPQLVHDTIRLKDTATGRTVDLYPCWYNSYLGIPKLVGARFTKSGISLDLYDTGCKMFTKVYETDYDHYDYFWNGNDLKIGKPKINTIRHTDAFWKQFTSSSYAYIIEEVITQRYYLSADYSLNYRRIGIYAQGGIGYKADLDTRVSVGIRIKLK